MTIERFYFFNKSYSNLPFLNGPSVEEHETGDILFIGECPSNHELVMIDLIQF